MPRWPRRRLTDLAWRLRHPRWARDRTQSLDPTATPPPPLPQSDPTQALYRYFLDQRSGLPMHKWHHYFDIYERHFAPFRGRGISMIEIGVHRGGSLRMWRDYFGPGCRVAGIDIDPACAAVADQDISIFIGDQADPKFLREVLAQTGPPDIVLDDGGHDMRQQIASFETIYPAMRTPGVYMVEDAVTSLWGDSSADTLDGSTFLDRAFACCVALHGWTRTPRAFRRLGIPPAEQTSVVQVSEFCSNTNAITFYDSVVAFERKARQEPWHEAR
jgi:hypothetical protein